MTLRQAQSKRNQIKTDQKNSTGKGMTFADLFAASESKVPRIRRNQEVLGTVVSVSPTEILIDVGAKSEGIVTGRELSAVSNLASQISIGDKVEATVIQQENDAGQVVLSLRKLSGEKRWTELEEKRENNEEIDVVALEVNRGGVICEYVGIRGFLPASQLTSSPVKIAELIGKTLSVKVIEVDRSTNRLILSQKQSKDLEKVQKLLAKAKIGEKVDGMVTAVLPFGVFVEIEIKRDKETKEPKETNDKMEGLVHVSEISWEKVEDPSKLFNVGDKVEVMIVAKDEENGRLNLSLKQLQKDPFLQVSEKFTKDLNIKGTVGKVTPYGVFVELQDGIEGLIHISKIPPDISFEVGQQIDCTVDSVDTKSRRIALVPVAKAKPILYR